MKKTLTLAIILTILMPFRPAIAENKADFPSGGRPYPIETEVRKPRKIINVVATAYNSEPGQTDDTPFITANGSHVHPGTMAANFLPFGTYVRIPQLFGDRLFVVEDRMNSRYGYGRVDVWMDGHGEAVDFGVQRVKMEVL